MSSIVGEQQLFIVQGNIFGDAANWPSKSGDNINKPASIDFRAANNPTEGTMVVSNALDQPYGGALVSRHLTLPKQADGSLLPFIAYKLSFRFSKATYYNLARHEVDVKVCIENRPNSSTPIRNVCNYSSQWNLETGSFEIDHDPPKWVDSGFVVDPATIDPGVWHSLEYHYTFDEAAGTFSILSIQFDENYYEMPPEHQNIPLQQTNWEEVVSCQLQNEGFGPGAVLIDYQDGQLVWSDQPIPADF